MVGFIIFFINNVKEEKEEIGDNLYIYNDSSTERANGNNDNVVNSSTSNVTSNNNYISKEEALKKALEDVKINQNDIYDTNVELDYKYNQTVYEIDFNYQQFEYEYYINAETGEIVKSFKEKD